MSEDGDTDEPFPLGEGIDLYRHRADAVTDEVGTGPPLVCLHGTLMDRTMFRPQFELADDYRVIAADLRARTDRWEGPYDLWDLVEDCRLLLDAKGIDRCVLAGMSMGGYTALRFALRYPERLDGLVLIDSEAGTETEDDRERYQELVDAIPESGVPGWLAETVAHILFGETTREQRPDLVERWMDRWTTYHPGAIAHETGSWMDRSDLYGHLDAVEVPALVVHGEEDAAIDVDRGAATAERLPEARLERIPDAGHSANLERPEPVNDAIRAFLQTVY